MVGDGEIFWIFFFGTFFVPTVRVRPFQTDTQKSELVEMIQSPSGIGLNPTRDLMCEGFV